MLRCTCCRLVLQFPGGPPRSLEDLKDRYYSIARKLLVAREGTDSTVLNQPLLRQPYNANQGKNITASATSPAARTHNALAKGPHLPTSGFITQNPTCCSAKAACFCTSPRVVMKGVLGGPPPLSALL